MDTHNSVVMAGAGGGGGGRQDLGGGVQRRGECGTSVIVSTIS